MAERLKQIWAGFEEVTSRRLTGRGVDNIIVPHRADYAEEDDAFLPEDFVSPAQTAIAALRADLAAKEKKFGFGRKSAARNYADDVAPTPMAEREFNGDELIQGLRSTAMRVERGELDYERYLSSDEGRRAAKKLKKKRFGIF